MSTIFFLHKGKMLYSNKVRSSQKIYLYIYEYDKLGEIEAKSVWRIVFPTLFSQSQTKSPGDIDSENKCVCES